MVHCVEQTRQALLFRENQISGHLFLAQRPEERADKIRTYPLSLLNKQPR